MKVGISTATLFPEKHTEQAVEVLNSLGAEITEVFFSTFYEYRPEFSEELKRKLGNLKVGSVHTVPLNFEPNLFDCTRRVRGDGFYWLDQVARSAKILGASDYTFHGFVRMGNSEDDLGYIGERIAEAHAFLAGYAVNLCLENTARYAYNRPGFFKAVKASCPDLYGVFDIKQARRSGYPYQMYIEDMAGAIGGVHLSDVREDGSMCLPGEGIYDFSEILKRLKGAGFGGNIVIENYRGDYGDLEQLKKSLDFLREICYKLG